MKNESGAAHLRQGFRLRQGYGGQDGGQAPITATSDRWERLAVLFEGELAVSLAERDAYVRAHCPDPGLAAEIKVLLSAQLAGAGPVDRVMAACPS